MKYLYYLIVVLVLVLGVGVSIQYGMQGRAVPKIKLSSFNNFQEVSESILMRLRQELVNAPVLFIGVEPNQAIELEIVNSFIGQNQDALTKYSSVLVELDLPQRQLLSGAEPIDIKLHHERLKVLFQKAVAKGDRVLVVAPHIYVSQLIKESPVSRMIKEAKLNITSISFVPLEFDLKDIDKRYFPCLPEENDSAGLSPLGCAVQKQVSNWLKKKTAGAAISGKLEQYGLQDYLFFLHFVR